MLTPHELVKKIQNYFEKRREKKENEKNDTISQEAKRHGKSYTSLLKIYVNSTRINLYIKIVLKFLFFFFTMGSLIAVVWIFWQTLKFSFGTFDNFENYNDLSIEVVLSVLTVLVPAIASVITAFIKIPQIIASYLFNTKEDQYMSSIIKNIQDYDKEMFSIENKLNEMINKNKETTSKAKDDEVDEVIDEFVDEFVDDDEDKNELDDNNINDGSVAEE